MSGPANPANKIGFQPFKEQLTDWTKEQMTYLKGRKEDVTV